MSGAIRRLLVAAALVGGPVVAQADPSSVGYTTGEAVNVYVNGYLDSPANPLFMALGAACAGGAAFPGQSSNCPLYVTGGGTGGSSSGGSSTAPPFTRVALDTATIANAGASQTVAAAGTAPHEVCVSNTTPSGTAGLLYVDPTGASMSGGTPSVTARQVDPPQAATLAGALVCFPTPANAVTIMATTAGVTFRGWKG